MTRTKSQLKVDQRLTSCHSQMQQSESIRICQINIGFVLEQGVGQLFLLG